MTQAFHTATGSTTLREAPGQRQADRAAFSVPWARAAEPGPRLFRLFTPALGFLLVGYLFLNKSFAYLHVPGTPVFVGEIVIAIGVFDVLRVRSPWYHLLQSSAVLRVLLAFMSLCALRLVADLPRYRLDAVRDSSIWYYGVIAFLVAAAAVREPTFVPTLVRWYRRVLPWYFLWAPIAVALTEVEALDAVLIPGTSTPVNAYRYTDIAVHVGMGLGFLWLGVDRMVGVRPTRSREPLISVLGLVALLAVGSQTRGGFLAALTTLGIVLALLPPGRRRRIALSGTVGLLIALVMILALDVRIEGDRRDISVQQVMANLSSLAGDQSDADLTGTVQWREGFWRQVLGDLLGSQAWLTGLGFGEILPERYEVDVGDTNSDTSTQPLRSVHNSHLTLLARTGFPGFALWLLLWMSWAVQLFGWVRRRPGGVRDPTTAFVAWLMASVPAFLVGAYFDPSLEGPHVAIWLFTVVGLGVAATRVRRPVTVPVGLGVPGAVWLWTRRLVPQRALLAGVRSLARQLRRSLADQAVPGLVNLAVGLYVARSFGVQQLGAFSIVFATYLLLLAAFHALAGDASAVRPGAGDGAGWYRSTAAAAGRAVVVGLAAGAGCVLASLPLTGSTGAAMLGLGITLPGLLLRDTWASAFLANGRRTQAVVNDLLWALALLPAIALLVRTGHASVGWTMLAWGGAATVAAAAGAVQARLVPQVTGATEWLRRHRGPAARSFEQRLRLGGVGQLRLYGLAAIAGLAAAGSLSAAELLLGPPVLLIVGLAGMAAPEAVRLLDRSPPGRLLRFCMLVGAVGAVGALLWGAALLSVPGTVGVQLLQSAWLPASQLLLPVTLAVAGSAFSVAAWAGMRALGAPPASLAGRWIGPAAYLAGALGGAALGGAAGAAWGSVAGTVIDAGVRWWRLRRAVKAGPADA